MTFISRLKKGEEAELLALEISRANNLEVITTKKKFGDSWNRKIDKAEGDLYFPSLKKRTDVKRASISLDSLHGFQGDGFWVFHYWLHECFYIGRQHLLGSYKSLNFPREFLSSGDPGIKYHTIRKICHNMIQPIHFDIRILENLIDKGLIERPKAFGKFIQY